MKTSGSLALDTSIVVRHLRTGDAVVAVELSAATAHRHRLTLCFQDAHFDALDTEVSIRQARLLV